MYYWAGACLPTVPSTDGVVNRAEVRVIATVVRVPESVQKRYGIFTTTRSFGCVSVPNGEPAIGESNPVKALVEALMVKTEMSPPTLLVTSRNFPDGSNNVGGDISVFTINASKIGRAHV